ncbi:HEAT repeat domain-containing protein [Streptomyces sp. NPDC001153]
MSWAEAPDNDPRRAAIWLLGYVPEPADLPLLMQAAQDPDERTRSTVVGTLGSHGKNPVAVDVLVGLLADPSTQVRVSALSSLGFLRQPGALPKIFRLADDSNTRIRAWVAIALGRYHAAEPAIPPSLLCSTGSRRTPTHTSANRPPPHGVRHAAAAEHRRTDRHIADVNRLGNEEPPWPFSGIWP